jgi:hypothetical protein
VCISSTCPSIIACGGSKKNSYDTVWNAVKPKAAGKGGNDFTAMAMDSAFPEPAHNTLWVGVKQSATIESTGIGAQTPIGG